jgi:hypothetical protein
VTISKAPLQHAPAVPPQPPFGHPLAHLAEFLPRRGHGANLGTGAAEASSIERPAHQAHAITSFLGSQFCVSGAQPQVWALRISTDR